MSGRVRLNVTPQSPLSRRGLTGEAKRNCSYNSAPCLSFRAPTVIPSVARNLKSITARPGRLFHPSGNATKCNTMQQKQDFHLPSLCAPSPPSAVSFLTPTPVALLSTFFLLTHVYRDRPERQPPVTHIHQARPVHQFGQLFRAQEPLHRLRQVGVRLTVARE